MIAYFSDIQNLFNAVSDWLIKKINNPIETNEIISCACCHIVCDNSRTSWGSRDNPHKNIAGSSFVLLKMTSGPRAGLADHLFLPHETQRPFKFTSLILLLLGLKMFIWTTSPCGITCHFQQKETGKKKKNICFWDISSHLVILPIL